jgi:maltose 6'-phosphate phosphatase
VHLNIVRKAGRHLYRSSCFFVLLLLLTVSCSSDKNSQGISDLNILTINLLFSELPDRSARLEAVADFVKEKNDASDPVDIILLQEVVGGLLSGTSNSSVDLLNKLKGKGLTYNIFYRLSNGLPALLQEGNAILSRHEILSADYLKLPVVSEEINEDFQITLRQEIIMAVINVPGFGKVDVYDTHFCAFCDPAGRLQQTHAAIDFVENTRSLLNENSAVILGGDFNVDANITDDLTSYEFITNDTGFIDSYSLFNKCTVCCSTEFGYSSCTYAVPGNVYATPLFQGQPVDTGRIDYIFIKGAETLSSQVVFNDSPWVSDHSGVLTKIKLD